MSSCIQKEPQQNRLITFEDRLSDSPVVERVWRSQSDRAGEFHSIAGCHWGMVVSRVRGQISLTVRGPETFATIANCPPEGEWVGVLFKLGTFMPLMRSVDLRDRKDWTLQNASSRAFWLNGSTWEFPGFDNMDTFVRRLVKRGLVRKDPVATAAIHGEPQRVTRRTEERRVLQVTGLTCGAIHQIERARNAALRLREGVPILDVVHALGFYDQAHLTRSLKRFIGQTPARISQDREQLSLLYNS